MAEDQAPQRDLSAELLAAALEYARRGWLVFPVHTARFRRDGDRECSCSRPDCRSAAKHPRTAHGHEDATLDEGKIEAFWHRHPDSNIGIVTGIRSRLVVLDIDPRHDGENSLQAWIAQVGSLPETLEVQTGGGGRHLFFAYPPGVDRIVSRAQWNDLSGIDLKADGGYIVAPPSRHISGKRYAWSQPLHDRQIAPTLLPLQLLMRSAADEARPSHNGTRGRPSERILEGRRNSQLMSMAGSMRRAGFDQPAVEAALDKTNVSHCVPPLTTDEILRIAASVTKYPSVGSDHSYALTDLGNAERFAAQHGDGLLYCAPMRQWLLWNGTRWERDAKSAVELLAMATIRSLTEAAESLKDPDARHRLVRHALRSEGRRNLEAMLGHAKALCAIDVTALDADPWLLNVRNGTIDLRTGTLLDHARKNRITKFADVTFEPDVDHPVWTRFLEQMVPNSEVRSFLARAAGYSLTGDTSEEKLFFLHGPTASGKSTFAEALRAALGDYASTADFETFLKRRDPGIRNDLARLAGMRLVLSLEVDEGRQLAVAVLKSLTGGDTITARFLHREHFEFRPAFKLWLVANEKPRANAADDALWRRVEVIPFLVSLETEQRDPNVKKTLVHDPQARAAILAWAVRGLVEWRQHGLQSPGAVKSATDAYREACDELGGFFEECCDFQPNMQTTSAQLKAACDAWCRENVVAPPTTKALAKALRRRDCQDIKLGGARAWTGIGLLVEDGSREDG